MAVIRTSGLPADFKVQPHVQAFADEAEQRFGIDSFGTYQSHQPSPDLAVDCFGTRAEMLALAQACTRDDVIDRFKIDYAIHDIDPGDHDPGEIWNRDIAKKWREMADRGGPTQNHYDHVHVSFEPMAPTSNPSRAQEAKRMFIVTADGVDEKFYSDLAFFRKWIRTQAELDGLKAAGVPSLKVSREFLLGIPKAPNE